MMGVSWEDSFIVAELIGMKTFFNEFVAYQKLSKLIKNRKAGGPEYVDHVKQYISVSLTCRKLCPQFGIKMHLYLHEEMQLTDWLVASSLFTATHD